MRLGTRFFLSALLCASAASAASIHGTVFDASGRPVPRCRLTIYARDGHQRLTTVADIQGQYRVEGLGAGGWLVEADAPGMTRRVAATASIGESDAALDIPLDLKLEVAEVRTEVVVTATGAPQSTDETAKSLTTLDAADLDKKVEFSVVDALHSVPGIRVQTLGGPGSYARIISRGLRPQDTSITVDGLRFRDAATTQGDATPFLQDLMLLGTERIEVLRGTGSSVYGSHATGGVVNLVTDSGGGPIHGQIEAEGGGLGMMRGLAKLGGGALHNRLHYTAGVQSTDFLSGLDGNDRYRNHSAQTSVQYRFGSAASLTARAWAADSFAQVNTTPYLPPANFLPAGDIVVAQPVSLDVQHRIEAGLPFTYDGNFVPNLDDPDSRRASRFLSGALVWSQQLASRLSYRVSYHRVVTNRRFDDGPGGQRFQPPTPTTDGIRGGTDTVTAQADLRLTHWNTVSGGYEFERESYRSRHLEAPPAPAENAYFTAAGQRDSSLFLTDQFRLINDKLQIALSGRWQHFSLRAPVFTGGVSPYAGLAFPRPPDAKTGDAAVAYFVPASGTKFRAHVGNGYRSPSIFERLGSTYYEGSFTALGDPRLRPERTVAFDMGVDQYLLGQKARVSATWFYTNLQETILFDFSGLINPATDPLGRYSGYINSGGAIARGFEASAEVVPTATLKLRAAYTYTNGDVRRSNVGNRDFFEIPFTSPHQFSLVATQRLTRRIDVVADFWDASRNSAVFSSRAYLFAGPRKLDLVGNYTLPAGDRGHWRFYGKVSNLLDSQYLEGGYRTPGRWGIGGIEFQF
jgi:iron complex outermembrane receptor protein